MIAMNHPDGGTLAETVKRLSNGSIIVIGSTDTASSIVSIDGEQFNSISTVYIEEYVTEMESITDGIDKVALAMERFGAAIHHVYSRYFNRYMWTVKFWPSKIHKKFSHQTQTNVVLQQHYSGTHPQNHGRHFNRRVCWRRK